MPEFRHQPVLLREVVEALQPRTGGRYADGTVGGGGHAEAILEASSPDGWLHGFDRDTEAVAAARARLARFAGRFEIRHGTYAEMGDWIREGTCDGVLLDLGISSHQLDEARRGFSFQTEGPLDMRMDSTRGRTAAQIVNESSAEELARIFFEFGEEPQARKLARAMVEERRNKPFSTTKELADFIEKLSPRRGKIHPATRVFQALRMATNEELELLGRGLKAAWKTLKKHGRLAVITFHSLEDRMVKEFGRQLARDYAFEGEVDVPELRRPRLPELRLVQRKAVKPQTEEIESNPRSRSAQLRIMERI